MRSDRPAVAYLAAQGAAGLAWWVLLLASDTVRDLFFVGAEGWASGRSLLLADVIVFALGSLAAAGLAHRRHSWARPAVWVVVGATAYATLVAVGWLIESIGEPLGPAMMAPALVGTGWAARLIGAAATADGPVAR
ncbi:MAG: hypothetical protein AAF962_23065 [Actinomycetota bacterium]